MTSNSVNMFVKDCLEGTFGSGGVRVDCRELPETRAAGRATQRVFLRSSRAVGFAAAALLLLAGMVTSASAANNCVKSGVVSGACTLDANFTGTITLLSNSTLDCRGLYSITGNL